MKIVVRDIFLKDMLNIKKMGSVFKKKMDSGSVFRKTMENVRKHRDIKLVTTDKRRNQLASEPNYHPTKQWKCKE